MADWFDRITQGLERTHAAALGVRNTIDRTHKFGGETVMPVNPQAIQDARSELERRYQERQITADQFFEAKDALDTLAGEAGRDSVPYRVEVRINRRPDGNDWYEQTVKLLRDEDIL